MGNEVVGDGRSELDGFGFSASDVGRVVGEFCFEAVENPVASFQGGLGMAAWIESAGSLGKSGKEG